MTERNIISGPRLLVRVLLILPATLVVEVAAWRGERLTFCGRTSLINCVMARKRIEEEFSPRISLKVQPHRRENLK